MLIAHVEGGPLGRKPRATRGMPNPKYLLVIRSSIGILKADDDPLCMVGDHVPGLIDPNNDPRSAQPVHCITRFTDHRKHQERQHDNGEIKKPAEDGEYRINREASAL